MNTYLNKEEWDFLNDLSNPNFESNFELLIQKYIAIANDSNMSNVFPNKNDINTLTKLIKNEDWIYKIEINNNLPNKKTNEERFKKFCSLLSSIGMLDDFYQIYGTGTKQDRILATCYMKLINKQKKIKQNFITNQVSQGAQKNVENTSNINLSEPFIVKSYLKLSTVSTVGQPFISKVVLLLPDINDLKIHE